MNNKRVKTRLESLIDSTVNVKSKEVRELLNEPMRMEQLDGLPERPPEDAVQKRRRKRRAKVTDPTKVPKFYEKIEKRRNDIN